MTIHGRKITDADMHDISGYMDDEIREAIHAQLAPCSNEEFIHTICIFAVYRT